MQQLQLQTPKELAVSKVMTRFFLFADFMISNSLEALHKPEEFSLAYFEHVTNSLAYYIRELTKLVSTGTEGHFVMIAKKVQQMQQHLSELDKLKVKCCGCTSIRKPAEDSGSSSSCSGRSLMVSGDTIALRSSTPTPPTPPPPLEKEPRRKLTPFDGSILNWLYFSTSYLSIINSGSNPHLKNDPVAQFCLLNESVDEVTRVRVLENFDPAAPDMSAVLDRLSRFFVETPKKAFIKAKLSIRELPTLKNCYSSGSWLVLLKAANKAAVLLAHVYRRSGNNTEKGTEEAEEEASAALATVLLSKLPPRYQDHFKDNLDGQRPSLELFAAYCEHVLTMIEERKVTGLPTEGEVTVSNDLCPICEVDYHYPENCDFELAVRLEAVKAKDLCVRCLLPEHTGSKHHCVTMCNQCAKRDHHIALCPKL